VSRLWVKMPYDICVSAITALVSVTALNPGLFTFAFSHRTFLWRCTCSSSFHSVTHITRTQATWCLIHSWRGSYLSKECCPTTAGQLNISNYLLIQNWLGHAVSVRLFHSLALVQPRNLRL